MKNKDYFVVLDIGSCKIQSFIGNKNDNDTLNVVSMGFADHAGFSNGEWLEPENLKKAVSKCIQTMLRSVDNFKIKKIYLGVPGEFCKAVSKEVFEQYKSAKKITQKDINYLYEKGNNFAGDKNYSCINCSAISYFLDNKVRVVEPVGRIATKLSCFVSYMLCEKSFISLFTSIFNDLNINEVEFISANWAEAVSLFNEGQRDKFIILCDVGFLTSSVMLIRGDGLIALRSFSVGGGHIVADLCVLLNIGYNDALSLKDRVNLNSEPSAEKFSFSTKNGVTMVGAQEVNDIACARVEDIANMINFSLDDFSYKCPKNTAIYLTGGGIAKIRGIENQLSKYLKRKVETICPSVLKFEKESMSSIVGLLEVVCKKQTKGASFFQNILDKFRRI
ncbi:MAG: hypothetical protein RR454_03990 [Clostridia bacterium]